MKGTIASLVLLALELTLCLVSSRWHSVEVNDTQICFKNLFVRFNTSSSKHQYLHVGPLYSSRLVKADNTFESSSTDHAKTETILIITGIGFIIISAITLSSIEFCLSKSFIDRYRIWFHLVNVILLIISLIILIVSFYSLQHMFKHSLNGVAALGFFIGILFMVALTTHSAITFWADIWHMRNKKIEKVAI
ncbi:unnamed protein product [Rotaria socialis]|uniref:Uncharacterized protein n=2 Tax=Rotaria socialis TaxID=392032 RepID=A0A820Z8W0_9BILA|nr:unnamed protein product [Rotaria socialis]CAF4558165.1 unnamed protein product [Rotaria socialis]